MTRRSLARTATRALPLFALATVFLAPCATAQVQPSLTPVVPQPGAARTPPAPLPPPVTASEQRYREVAAYIRSRGTLDDATRSDLLKLAASLDADLDAPTSTRETIARLCPPRAQVAIWLSDDAAMHKAFERLLSLSPDNDAVTIAWAREAVASADYELALDLLQRRKIEGPRAVQAHLLRATALIGINRFTDAQAALNTAPMARQPDEAVQIGEMSARITKLNDVWAKELSAISRDQNGEPLPTVELLTSKGPILLELFEEQAPFTVRNFVERVESGAYDGTRFHRFQRGFAIQGGDPETAGGGAGGKGTGGWLIPDEIEPNSARAPLFGRLVMAKQPLPQDPANPAPNTAGSQFAILFSTSEHLAEKFTVFGRVIDGWDAARELVANDEIVQARMLTKRDHAYEAVRLPDAPGQYTFPRPAPPRAPATQNANPTAATPGGAPTVPVIRPAG